MDVLLFLNALLRSRLVYIFRDPLLRTPSLVLIGTLSSILPTVLITQIISGLSDA